jgi:AcrR family transcriptional regulator
MYHDLIFDCAERVFAENGFDECTMQDVAAEAGISLKTLYNAFPGKNEIYAEIQAVRGIAFLDQVRGAGDGSALEKLDAGLRAFVSFLVEHDAYRRILLREGHAWPRLGHGEHARAPACGREPRRCRAAPGMDEGVFHEGDASCFASVTAVMQVQLRRRLFRAGNQSNAEEIATARCGAAPHAMRHPDAPRGQALAAAG